MACTLILMRHAKSDHGDPSLSDHQRPLNKRGRRDAPRMADWLAEEECVPQRVLCSTATRTRETLDLMLDRWDAAPSVDYCESLYLASSESILWTISSDHAGASSLLVLGHNPGISMVASVLAQTRLEMPTAAIAVLKVVAQDGNAHEHPLDDIGVASGCALTHFITPKTLD